MTVSDAALYVAGFAAAFGGALPHRPVRQMGIYGDAGPRRSRDPHGDTLSYPWRQTEGIGVDLPGLRLRAEGSAMATPTATDLEGAWQDVLVSVEPPADPDGYNVALVILNAHHAMHTEQIAAAAQRLSEAVVGDSSRHRLLRRVAVAAPIRSISRCRPQDRPWGLAPRALDRVDSSAEMPERLCSCGTDEVLGVGCGDVRAVCRWQPSAVPF